MRLSTALRLDDGQVQNTNTDESRPLHQSIALVGSGGKSSALFQLARQLIGDNQKKEGPHLRPPHPGVIVTATTHLGAWQLPLADTHLVAEDARGLEEVDFRGVTLVTGPMKADGRTRGVSTPVVNWLHARAGQLAIPLLIEADFVDTLVHMSGLTALGKALNEQNVHHPQIFSALSGLEMGRPITREALIRVLTHPNGGLKNRPPSARMIALLNQADTPDLQAAAQTMVPGLLPAFDSVIIANLRNELIHAVFEPGAGIILAAGESSRFGQTKQLLDWRGEPFVRAVARTALASGLAHVSVVVGADAERVVAAVQDLPVLIVPNENWRSGQSSSIRAGLAALPENIGSAIFLLADQPQMTIAVIRALENAHAAELFPIVAPLVMMEQRTNPVLFDRWTFPDLRSLQGDVGGRAIFSKYQVELMPWHDDSLMFDVDQPDDYPRMKELE